MSLIQFSQATKTVLSFADDYDTIINAIENDMTMDDFVAQGEIIDALLPLRSKKAGRFEKTS